MKITLYILKHIFAMAFGFSLAHYGHGPQTLEFYLFIFLFFGYAVIVACEEMENT